MSERRIVISGRYSSATVHNAFDYAPVCGFKALWWLARDALEEYKRRKPDGQD